MIALDRSSPRVRIMSRLAYQEVADRRCRRRLRGSPRLLERLASKLSQSRHIYLLNFWDRGGIVGKPFVGKSVRIHRGRRWRVLQATKWHKGWALGSFSRSRRVAAFKAKAANKKRKKVSKGAQLLGEMRISQYRAVQLGQKRRTSTKLNTSLEATLRSIGP